MGPGKAKSTEKKLAYQLGKLVAQQGAVLLTGGMGGIMEEASRGAKEENGLVIAICPTYEREDVNKFVDIPIMTGMRGGRNYINILSSDIVIAIGHTSAGTLSEIAFAIQLEKPVIIMQASTAMENYLSQFKARKLRFVKDIEGVQKLFLNKNF